jgi:hypothetical protein
MDLASDSPRLRRIMTREEAKTINNMVGSIVAAFDKEFPIKRVIETNKGLRNFQEIMRNTRSQVADYLIENIDE